MDPTLPNNNINLKAQYVTFLKGPTGIKWDRKYIGMIKW